MCFPALLAAGPAIMTGLSAVSTGLGVIGGLQQSRAQQAQLRYQSQLAGINADQADAAARDALERGELDAIAHGRQVAALRGQQRSQFAAAGLEADYGTPLDIANDTSLLSAEDTSRIYSNAEREAQGYRINASNYRAEAAGASAARSASKASMFINAGSTLIGGATQIGATWAKYGKPRGF